jgi:Icc protein
MAEPFLLVQLSDPHIGADWGGDPVATLAAAVEAVRKLHPGPDAVLVSGDLTDNGADAEYEQVRALLAPLAVPIHVLAGNHDDRDALRRHFGVPGAKRAFVQYAADLGPLRLVVLDTTRPGEDGGELDEERLAWLDAELAAAPDKPTIVAMHHPPLATGIPAQDAIGLPAHDRHALGEVVARHPQVKRLVGGHMHLTIAADLGGRAVLCVPSTYVQAQLEFRAGPVDLATTAPAGFAVHALVDGELTSYVQPVPGP